MKILIACECSGVVRDAFIKKGHNAISCDILPSELPGPHYQGDVIPLLKKKWDMLIAFPPCTYLCVTGNKWMLPEFKKRFPNREKQREDAIRFFLTLCNAPIKKIAIENPVGIMSSHFRKPDQYIHPYYFGDAHAKKTGLWLTNLPKLIPTKIVNPKYYIYKDGRRDPLWHVQTMTLDPLERAKVRSRTFKGIASAMAEQWG